MRRRTALAVGLPVAALGAVAAVVIASGGGADGDGGSPAGARRGGTQVVARRTLVERVALDGTLGYGSERAAMDRLGGTLTWLPSAGAVIRPGRRLFAVDGEPVILMDGSVPAWRALAVGVSDGADVRELERTLADLGYDPGTVDVQFSAATAAAVSRWQHAAGLPRSGRVELGRVVFLPGARRVAKVEAALGSTGGGSGSPAAWDGGGEAHYAYADYRPEATSPATTPTVPDATTPTVPTTPTTPTTPRTTPTTPTTPRTTPTAPSTTPTTPSASGTPSADTPSGGDGDPNGGDGTGSTATKVLTTTSTARVVTADLDASDQGLARVGRRAVVTLPDGRRVRGTVVRVGTVATASDDGSGAPGGDDGGSDPTLPLTIRLDSARAAGRLDQAPVAVSLARTTRRDVLAVPVAALLARSGGGYAVRVVRASGTAVSVPVEPGLFADGYVELVGGAVRAGDRVEVPR